VHGMCGYRAAMRAIRREFGEAAVQRSELADI